MHTPVPDQALENRQVPNTDSSVQGSVAIVVLHVQNWRKFSRHPAAGIFDDSVRLRLNGGVEESPSPGVSQGGALRTLLQHDPDCVEAASQGGDMYRVQSFSVRLIRSCACVGI